LPAKRRGFSGFFTGEKIRSSVCSGFAADLQGFAGICRDLQEILQKTVGTARYINGLGQEQENRARKQENRAGNSDQARRALLDRHNTGAHPAKNNVPGSERSRAHNFQF
jgi:hypothetical protein